ncbi:hypothetical protein GCM10028811_15070 [Uliginosibacterium sediminicola]
MRRLCEHAGQREARSVTQPAIDGKPLQTRVARTMTQHKTRPDDGPAYRIEIEASSEFIAEQSDPDEERYVFSYRIRIHNAGPTPARLISRHWIITDANGAVQEVRGDGVIGEQPLIAPGETYEYSSGCSLNTAVGTMRGAYQMLGADDFEFDAEIPEFLLAGPRVLH